MDDDIARLVGQERIVAAAELARSRGQAPLACSLFERACDWASAAREAIASEDYAHAMLLAVRAGDDALADEASGALIARGQGEAVARDLLRAGSHAWAARLLESAGNMDDAARAYARAGQAQRAATLLERGGDVVAAARVLEAALAEEPARYDLAVCLGALLVHHGKPEQAIRTLQRIPRDSPERRAALNLLVRALGAAHLPMAEREARDELARMGGPADSPAHDSEPPLPSSRGRTGPRLFGRYDVVRDVAHSPVARVVECVDRLRGERVAIKIFSGWDAPGAAREALTRFEHEVRVTSGLHHPNIVPIVDIVMDAPALVLRWMGGGSLQDMGSCSPARAAEICGAVLSALADAHHIGVLHRNIRPSNVLFDDAGVTHMADFGSAHMNDLSATITAGGARTLKYLSPEQREGRAATVQSDIYAVGMMFLELLLGPMDAPGQVLPSAVHRDLDARHDAVILSLVAPEPHRRPRDAFIARNQISLLPWPDVFESAAPSSRRIRPDDALLASTRLTPREGASSMDAWTGRRIDRIPIDALTLARARAFARADHPALQLVLSVRRDAQEIWLASPAGERLARPLSASEVQRVADALRALHAQGCVHGAVTRDAIYIAPDGQIVLCFASPPNPNATLQTDLDALVALSRGHDV